MTTNWGGRRAQKATAWVLSKSRTCWICNHPGADSLDHIVPRSIAPERTWDPTNWAPAHGTARPEYNCPGQYARGNYIGPRRPDPTTTPGRLQILIGPPCAGKTTHALKHRQPGDLIIDTDALAAALGSPTTHTSTGPHARAARTARTALIDQALRDKTTPAWIIHTAPDTPTLDKYTRAGAALTLLNPGRETCLRRAKASREAWTIPAILDWYTNEADRLQQYIAATPTTPATNSKREW